MPNSGFPKKWELLSREEVFHAPPWLRVLVDRVRLPSGRIVEDYYRVEAPDFVLVCAFRDDGAVLLERQFKQAAGKILYCLPAGCIETGESPADAARRELLEETGYAAAGLDPCGTFLVDGNRGIGTGHFFIARGIRKVSEPHDDDMEVPDIHFLHSREIWEKVRACEISSMGSLALLMMATHPDMPRGHGHGRNPDR